jgi:hypothetical protein
MRIISATILSAALLGAVFYYGASMAQRVGYGRVDLGMWVWAASLGWWVVTLFLFGDNFTLGERWHTIRHWEQDGSLYRLLGIRVYKLLAPNGDLLNRMKRQKQPDFRHIRNRASALEWAAHSCRKEAAHAVHFVIMLPVIGYAYTARLPAAASAAVFLCIAFDLYPVMLQRYNRARIERMLARRNRRLIYE